MRKAVALAVATLVLGAGLIAVKTHPIERYQRYRCKNVLKSLGYASWSYQHAHDQGPRQLAALSNELVSPLSLVCPSSGHDPGDFTNADGWSDYTLIDWPSHLQTNTVPGNYPLAYDRRVSNHAGRGVNVLRVDGLVVWDADVRWLRAFVAEHPNFGLLLPEQAATVTPTTTVR